MPPMPPPPGMPPLPALPKAGINVEDLERNLVQASESRLPSSANQLPSQQPPPGFSNDLFPMLRPQASAGPWPGFPPIGGLPPPMPMNSFGLGAGPGVMPPPFTSPMNMMPSAFMGMPQQAARPPSPPRQDKPLQLNQLPGFNLFGVSFRQDLPKIGEKSTFIFRVDFSTLSPRRQVPTRRCHLRTEMPIEKKTSNNFFFFDSLLKYNEFYFTFFQPVSSPKYQSIWPGF